MNPYATNRAFALAVAASLAVTAAPNIICAALRRR